MHPEKRRELLINIFLLSIANYIIITCILSFIDIRLLILMGLIIPLSILVILVILLSLNVFINEIKELIKYRIEKWNEVKDL